MVHGNPYQIPGEQHEKTPSPGEAGSPGTSVMLPRKVVAAMGLGSLGVSTLVNYVCMFLASFYLPSTSTIEIEMPDRVTSSRLLGVLSVIAVVAAATRVLHAAASLVVAAMNDSCARARGRRTRAMTAAILPVTIAFLLSFVPTRSIAYVAVAHAIFGALVTGYLVPLHALACDLGACQGDRVNVTMWMSKFWGLGIIVATCAWYLGLTLNSKKVGLDELEGFYGGAVIAAIFSGAAMTAPSFFVDESQHRPVAAAAVARPPTALNSLRACIYNPFFRPVVLCDTISTFAASLCLTTLTFYSSPAPEYEATNFDGVFWLLLFVFLSTFMYWVVHRLAGRGIGGRKLLRLALVASVAIFCSDVLLSCFGVSSAVLVVIPAALWALPYATLESVALWLTTDVTRHHCLKNDEDNAAMFLAVRYSSRAIAATAGPFMAAFLLNETVTTDEFGLRDYTASIAAIAALTAALYAANVFVIGHLDEATLRDELEELGDARVAPVRRSFATVPESSACCLDDVQALELES